MSLQGPNDLVERMRRVIADEIAPLFQIDGTSIEVLGVNAGVVQLRISGVCASCPSSLMTLIMGLEQEVRRRFPQIEYLEAVP